MRTFSRSVGVKTAADTPPATIPERPILTKSNASSPVSQACARERASPAKILVISVASEASRPPKAKRLRIGS